MGEVGLEPTKAKPADLQSAPFAARDTPPVARVLKALQRAGQVQLCRFRDHSEQFSGRYSKRQFRWCLPGLIIKGITAPASLLARPASLGLARIGHLRPRA